MSERRELLFAAATGAATGDFYLSGEECPASIFVSGMEAADTVDLQITTDGGATWEDSYSGAAQDQAAYQSNTSIGIYTPGHYKVNKGSTTGTVAAVLYTG